MKEIFKLSWVKFFIFILLLGITAYSFIYAGGCGLAMDSGLECRIYQSLALPLGFLLIVADFEKNIALAIILEVVYLYSLVCVLYGLYLVSKRRVSVRVLIATIVILSIVWGGYAGFVVAKEKKEMEESPQYMKFKNRQMLNAIKTKEECESKGYVWDVENFCK